MSPHAHSPHFLLAADLPAAAHHLAFAARLGERLQARSTLFHAVAPAVATVPEAFGAALPGTLHHEEARQALLFLAGDLGTRTPPHVAVDVGTDPASAIVAAGDRIHAALIVLPTHGRSGLSRLLLGSTAEQVLRRTTRPVLLLTEAMVQAERGDREPGPIVLATDLSPTCAAAGKAAADLARQLQRPLVLYSVVPEHEPAPRGGGASTGTKAKPVLQRVQERQRDLRRFGAELASDLVVEAVVDVHDDPAPAIVHEAKVRGAEILVVATHGRRGVSRVLFGSVAERVVRTATMPTVCVPVAPQ